MKSLVGSTLITSQGEPVTILRQREARTFPFFQTFYLYDISWRNQTLSIKCEDIDDLINGNVVFVVLD